MDLTESYFSVASTSMIPTFKPGDRISVESVTQEDIVPGMVIVFKTDRDRKIVHRVVEKKGFILVTAGDNLGKYDNPIHIFDVTGKVKDLEIKKPLSRYFRILRAIKRRIVRY